MSTYTKGDVVRAAASDDENCGQLGIVTDTYDVGGEFDISVSFGSTTESYGYRDDEVQRETATKFVVTGEVPQPIYNPKRPVHYLPDHVTVPADANGEAGRTISVTTTSYDVAQQLASVFKGTDKRTLFRRVKITPVA